jgi:hypothetical protein
MGFQSTTEFDDSRCGFAVSTRRSRFAKTGSAIAINQFEEHHGVGA